MHFQKRKKRKKKVENCHHKKWLSLIELYGTSASFQPKKRKKNKEKERIKTKRKKERPTIQLLGKIKKMANKKGKKEKTK